MVVVNKRRRRVGGATGPAGCSFRGVVPDLTAQPFGGRFRGDARIPVGGLPERFSVRSNAATTNAVLILILSLKIKIVAKPPPPTREHQVDNETTGTSDDWNWNGVRGSTMRNVEDTLSKFDDAHARVQVTGGGRYWNVCEVRHNEWHVHSSKRTRKSHEHMNNKHIDGTSASESWGWAEGATDVNWISGYREGDGGRDGCYEAEYWLILQATKAGHGDGRGAKPERTNQRREK